MDALRRGETRKNSVMIKISFIGAGHVAWHLSQALENAGNSVQEVFSRDPEKARDLVSYLYNARVQEHLDFSESSSTVFFLCVPESAYPQVLPELLLPKYATLVLVAGTVSLTESMMQYDPLRESTNQVGVLFPVQHLQAERKISLSNVPICIEVLVEETEATLVHLAKDISKSIYLVSGDERKKIHLAMLMAGLFTQQLWQQAALLLESIELDKSLIQGVVQNYVQAFFANQSLHADQDIAKLSDSRVVFDQQAFMMRPEMQEIYRNMLALVKSNPI
jgi:predicted short-subunit dehydrogenase-like oxidoreductase (DUF2520 family)